MKKITLYLCSKCGEEYRSKKHCEKHEKQCKAQNCECCKHHVLFYGYGYKCYLSMIGEICNFEAKEN